MAQSSPSGQNSQSFLLRWTEPHSPLHWSMYRIGANHHGKYVYPAMPQPAPLFCPRCGLSAPTQTSTSEIPNNARSPASVYRCECGYVFQVTSHLVPGEPPKVRPSSRPRVNFSTRDLLWLTVVIALICGMAVQYRAALTLQQMERVHYENQIRKLTSKKESPNSAKNPNGEHSQAEQHADDNEPGATPRF